ncbi:MAG: hypothetical protein DRQ55_01755 [Planctomycetota bacterium]|nr:MAG: hypothetical protein DRQ55_01755 [Planctomycetota bacterium]
MARASAADYSQCHMPTRRPSFALLLVALGAASAMACEPAVELPAGAVAAAAPADETAPEPAPALSAGDAFLKRATEEVIEFLAAGADIVMPGPVEVLLLTSEQATERRRRYAESLGDEVGYTAAMDSMADLMFSGNLLGRYFPDEEAVYVFEDAVFGRGAAAGSRDDERALETLFPVLAHEMVHAYDHMVYGVVPAPDDFDTLLADPAELPHIQALMSLLEGRATYASELACHAAGRRPLRARSVQEVLDSDFLKGDGSLGGGALARAGNMLIKLKLVQYAYGRTFAKRVHDFGGEAFFHEVFEHLPLGMDELEDFTLFLVRWAETKEAEMDG